MGKKFAWLLVLLLLVVLQLAQILAESADENEARTDMLESRLKQQKVKEEALPTEIMMKEKIEQEKPKPVLPEGKVFVKEINVVGVTSLPQKEIDGILEDFRNKELSGKEMQRCADQITDTYSLNGFITSYAYIDPAKLDQGILEIKAVEGKVGEVKIEGNHYFSTDVYKERIGLKKGDIFNLKLVKNNIFRTNKHPDRKLTLKVEPSDALEYTNIVVSVKDKFPLHFTFDHDNYGSEAILYKRYKNYVTYNNLTGHDDSLTFKAQVCEGDAQRLFDLDYFLPLNNTWKWELYYMPFKKENYYYADNKDTDFTKRAWKWYTYLYQTIYSEPNRELVLNYGFVQKFITWYSEGQRQKWDKFCAFLWGFDYVRSDDYGTTVLSDDVEQGIPRMWGADSAKDTDCSVKGAGGKYFKNKIAFARRQKLPWEMDLLMKIQGQYSTQALTGVNVFSIGGYMGTIDNRGYPRAQMPMDSGYYLMGGLSFPAYFVSKSVKIPFTNTNLYNNLKLFTFIEYAKGYKRSLQSAQDKAGSSTPDTSSKQDDDRRKSLKSAGCGFTFAIPAQGLTTRLDIGWPLDHKLPDDGKHTHILYRVTKTF